MRCSVGLAFFLAFNGVLGCGSDADPAQGGDLPPGSSEPDAAAPDPTSPNTPSDPPLAWLELRGLDIWGQPLLAGRSTLDVVSGETRSIPFSETVTLGLYRNGSFTVRLQSEQHHPVDLQIAFDGATATLTGPDLGPDRAPGLLVGHEVRLVDDPAQPGSAAREGGTPIPVHTAYVGLRHRWFSASGRPARHGNAIELLMDGEEAWGRVHTALKSARRDIRVSIWWWQSDFELVRSDDFSLSEDARKGNTILGLLEQSPAHKRVMVGQFWGQDSILSWITSDSALRAHAEQANDDFEFMGQANVTEGSFVLEPESFSFGDRVKPRLGNSAQSFDADGALQSSMPSKNVNLTEWPVNMSVQAASYHQKFLTVDEDLAFVGGMNLRPVDWDDHEHRIYNPKRMAFDQSQSRRNDVVNKSRKPDYGPRKDYMLRIEGPAAQDVNDVFHRRWDYLMDSGVSYSAQNTRFDVDRSATERDGGAQVQITTTLPAPFDERSIGETWFNAVRQAERYIFIEDQYFRVPMLIDAIVARMQERPELRLFVITKQVSASTDPGCAPTARMDAAFRYRFFNRYALVQLRSFDVTGATVAIDETDADFTDIDVHSKMLIVDDVFMSVGSANKNNRGILYEAEMNAAVVDPTFVSAARRRILANLLGPDVAPSDDAATWFSQLTTAASTNDAVYARWEAEGMDLDLNGAPVPPEFVPHGFLYSLTVPAEGACSIRPVGDDMVSAPPSATPSH